MRVLLVEDDPTTSKSIEMMLTHANLNVYTTDLGEEGIDLAKLYDYDLILLDLGLPDMNGHEVLRQLRMARVDTPILILSGADDTENKLKGFGFGADDYLTKPFEPKELVLRINAILRRVPVDVPVDAPPKTLQLGGVRYDVARGEMWRDTELVRLTATESALMRIFASSIHQPVSRGKLVEDLGRDTGQSQERAVDVQITRLRRKIEDDPKNPRYLQTVRGAGYMLAPD